MIALVIATLFGKIYIPWLHRQRAEQSIKENGPAWHNTKKGTPTMGGVMFILAVAASILTVGFSAMLQGEFAHLFVFAFALVFGAIGLLDDWEKIKNRQNTGPHSSRSDLSPREKLERQAEFHSSTQDEA